MEEVCGLAPAPRALICGITPDAASGESSQIPRTARNPLSRGAYHRTLCGFERARCVQKCHQPFIGEPGIALWHGGRLSSGFSACGGFRGTVARNGIDTSDQHRFTIKTRALIVSECIGFAYPHM